VDGYHNAESIRGMFPDGAGAFKGDIGKDVAVTLTREGVYLVKCKSHYAVGMVALVVVGALPDRETLARAVAGPHPAKAKAAFSRILASIPEK
ncbi:MAG: pseudoazurin, partial [Gammaproteobacteria bacterium]|nr:pseudoazurin [Gammaproteobacteria bacterium]